MFDIESIKAGEPKRREMHKKFIDSRAAQGLSRNDMLRAEETPVFDRDEMRMAPKDSIIDVDVEVKGEKVGTTKICSELDNDIITRNIGWLGSLTVTGGENIEVLSIKSLEVDKDAGVIRVETKKGLRLFKYIRLVEKEKGVREEQEEELKRIGFNEELDRILEERDMDAMMELVDQMPETRHKRFVYERMVKLEELILKDKEKDGKD